MSAGAKKRCACAMILAVAAVPESADARRLAGKVPDWYWCDLDQRSNTIATGAFGGVELRVGAVE